MTHDNAPKGASHHRPSNNSYWCYNPLIGLLYWSTTKDIWRKAHSAPDDLVPISAEARLIAAAPELYEALESMIKEYEALDRQHDAALNLDARFYIQPKLTKARSALAKVRGDA